MGQNNSHWPLKTNIPNFEFELNLWKLAAQHVNFETQRNSILFSGFDKCFTHWIDERAELREIINNGVKNFNWI